MVAYNVFPLFSSQVTGATLVGASASVLAIVAATAYREPNYRVQLFLFGAVRLKYLALVVIGIDVLSITSSNAGGHIAHLGGALAGLWFAASLSKGKDVTYWINWFLDGFASNRPRPPCRIVRKIIKVYRMVEYRRQLCVYRPQIICGIGLAFLVPVCHQLILPRNHVLCFNLCNFAVFKVR